MTLAKISEVTSEHILFSDGTEITYYHYQQCCEYNYADFEQLDDLARSAIFDTDNLKYEIVSGDGFRFGNDGKMFFVPCYSIQNGYYSDEVDIEQNGQKVITVDADYSFNHPE